MLPDETATNNRNALKAKRYDEIHPQLVVANARIAELEKALTRIMEKGKAGSMSNTLAEIAEYALKAKE